MSLLDKLDKFGTSKKSPEEKPEISEKKTEIKPIPKKRKITGDKGFNKEEICDYIAHYIIENKDNFTLDWLRGQKLTFESVNEMRKKS